MTEFVDVRIARLTKVERTKLSVGNVAIIKKFDKYNILKNNKESTRDQQIRILSLFARQVGKNFKQMTQSDIEAYFHNLTLKPYTKEYRRLVIVKFFKWLYNDDKPPIVSNLVPNKKAYDKEIHPDMLWTDLEIKELAQSLPHPRDKALVMVLYESEARVNELLSMNISDVEFEGDTCIIFLPDSKTKKRRVGLSFSVPYLQQWLDCHPMLKRGDKDAPLWMSLSNRNYGRRLSDIGVYICYNSLRKIAQ
jgi:integrase